MNNNKKGLEERLELERLTNYAETGNYTLIQPSIRQKPKRQDIKHFNKLVSLEEKEESSYFNKILQKINPLSNPKGDVYNGSKNTTFYGDIKTNKSILVNAENAGLLLTPESYAEDVGLDIEGFLHVPRVSSNSNIGLNVNGDLYANGAQAKHMIGGKVNGDMYVENTKAESIACNIKGDVYANGAYAQKNLACEIDGNVYADGASAGNSIANRILGDVYTRGAKAGRCIGSKVQGDLHAENALSGQDISIKSKGDIYAQGALATRIGVSLEGNMHGKSEVRLAFN